MHTTYQKLGVKNIFVVFLKEDSYILICIYLMWNITISNIIFVLKITNFFFGVMWTD